LWKWLEDFLIYINNGVVVKDPEAVNRMNQTITMLARARLT
jgi:hypothetical protein